MSDTKLPTAIAAKWALAHAEPGTPVDLDDLVVCDLCDTNYRGRTETGGLIFQSRAVCPLCVPKFKIPRSEESYVRARNGDTVSFWQFVLDYRRACGSNTITVRPIATIEDFRAAFHEGAFPEDDLDAQRQARAEGRISESFMASTEHRYGCRCDGCLSWWAQMGPDGEEAGDYGPFTKAEVNARQRELGIEETP